MAQELEGAGEPDLGTLVGMIAGDTERLLGLHLDLLRSELRGEVREVVAAVASMGAGAGLVATGGILGSVMAVHGLHQATRLPLWKCYGLVGGLLATVGAGMLVTGARRAANVSLAPRQTIEALKENLAWIKDQATPLEG